MVLATFAKYTHSKKQWARRFASAKRSILIWREGMDAGM
jgi:hypothetical protein